MRPTCGAKTACLWGVGAIWPAYAAAMDEHPDRHDREAAPVTHPNAVRPTAYTRDQWRTLHRLRDRYQRDRDLWSPREWAYLHFMRWLYQTGRLVS